MTAGVGVIGAGPAGIAAAVQLARHGVTPVVFERGAPGGLLRTAWLVENFPGFPDGIAGPDLARLLSEQLRASGAELVRDEVTRLDADGDRMICEAGGWTRRFAAVIVASGTRPRGSGVPGVPEEVRDRVFREVAGLWEMEGARITIVGGGDAAFDYAIGLSERNDVTVVMRGSEPRCLPLLEARARGRERVSVMEGAELVSVSAGSGRLQLGLGGSDEAGGRELSADYLVLAIGREPEDAFLSERVRRDTATLEGAGRLLFAGDVRSGIFRQASIAAGQGTHAAMQVAAALDSRFAAGDSRDRYRSEDSA
jgi:thioredoxin reductase